MKTFNQFLLESTPPGYEDWVTKNKQKFIDEYGEEKGLRILYATAWSEYNHRKQLRVGNI